MSKLPQITDQELAAVDAWWRADNYLTVAQIYLMDNALLDEPLKAEHIKPRLLGHWGTSPGLGFLYAHVSRLIRHTGQESLFITGPGHGGPALVAASYLEDTYTEKFPKVTQDSEGVRRLCRQFSAPGGIPSHVSVTTPGSIHEGGELGYALVHAFGSVMDNPDLLTVAVVGDGEAETGPLEGSWKGVSFINPARDGAVLPILHLNENKIAGPTVLGRKDEAEVRKLLEGHGYEVITVEIDTDTPHEQAHRLFSEALATAYEKITGIQEAARREDWDGRRPVWPMIIFRHPKGWTGPHEVDGEQVEGSWKAHQVPLSGVKDDPDHLALLEQWLKSYRPEELFDDQGRFTDAVRANNPEGDLRMSASPHANGGLLTKDLDLPDFREMGVEITERAVDRAESTRKLGEFIAEIYRRNPDNFRLFSPDETNSNRLGAVFEVSDRAFMEPPRETDQKLSRDGRVMEVLSEHNCHGWLEAYNLTGRHGMFATYESFAMVSASQTIQHSKWLDEANDLDWRAKIPSLNILLTSTCWRNDHNGFSHQGPGLIQNVLTQRGEVARVYLPPDANCLLSVADHVFRSRSYVNLVVIDKQPQPQWLTMDEAVEHCAKGAGIWDWAGNDAHAGEPDIVLACAGDIPTMETVAAAEILRNKLPQLKTRVVNVVDLMTLIRPKDHPHGMDETFFAELFTNSKDVVFAFHGYPGAIHQLVHGRPDADRFRVRGFIEEGTTTTPFDMVVRNRISRYHLVMDAINNAKVTPPGASELKQWCQQMLDKHESHIVEHLEDMPEVRDWKFGYDQQINGEDEAS
ncbi:phosphoketolase family protein [Luteococcus peritonei]|uniref:Phosphoketolase family protein n=1 Tax=Luteococcus peritonei TaxID=88874 RepID=A0ABW4RS06_9ACTN